MLAIKTLTDNLTVYKRNIRLMGDKFEISVVGNNPCWPMSKLTLPLMKLTGLKNCFRLLAMTAASTT